MPPKKKADAGGEDEVAIKFKTKRTKEILESFLGDTAAAGDIPIMVNKFVDSQGWARAGGPEEPKATNSLVFQGDIKEGQDWPSALTLKMVAKGMKQIVPLHCNVKSLCYWRCAVNDDSFKSVADIMNKQIKPGVWEGITALELTESRITAAACDTLGEKLANNIPLKSLTLDFNQIGDDGAIRLSKHMVTNTTLGTLSMAYCRLTSDCCEAIAEGVVRRSKTRVLNLSGNKIGTKITRDGIERQGSGAIPLFGAASNALVFEEPPSRGEGELDACDALLKQEHGAKMTDLATSTYKPSMGAWVGTDLRIIPEFADDVPPPPPPAEGEEAPAGGGVGEEVRRIYAMTETLTSLNLSNNCITADIEEETVNLLTSVEKDAILLPISETCIEAGRKQMYQGCYCMFGAEMVRVVSILPEGETKLSFDVDDKESVLKLSTGRASIPELQVLPGEALTLGSETVVVTKVGSDSVQVKRGESGTKAGKYEAGIKVTKACSLEVVRGMSYTTADSHPCGSVLERVSVIRYMCKQIAKLKLLDQLDVEHNNIGNDAAELLQGPTKKLSLFKFSGLEISEELFKEVYKDGTAKKGKKGKKKK